MNGGNPKDAIGASKAPLSTVSRRVIHELGLAMLEGECQYWRHNYRAADVRAMVYADALERHMSAWIEGQDIDPKSGLSHLVKAMACLMIIRDAQLCDSLIDDRPPAQADPNWIDALNAKALSIIESTKQFERGAYTEANRSEWPAMSAALNSGPIRTEKATYLPKPGERVRVLAIAPFDRVPFHRIGQDYETAGYGYTKTGDHAPSGKSHGWICLFTVGCRGATWCRVERV